MIKIQKTNILLFFSIFILLNIVFLYYTLHFFIGNHDWDWIKGTHQVLSLTTGMFEARFGKFILNVALYSGQIFPILNTVTSFALLSFGAVLLTKYFNINDKILVFLISAIVVTQPYILGWLYFPINILGNFLAFVLVTVGLILAERKNVISSILSILCFILSLGIYPSTVEMMMIVFAIKHIISPNEPKISITSFITIIIALILFKILLLILIDNDLIIQDYYNLKTSSILYILENIPNHIKLFFEQLWLTIPFAPKSLKVISILCLTIAILTTINSYKNILLWLISCASTILSAMLTPNIEEVAFQPRVNFYGLGILYVGSFAICMLNSKKIIKNIGITLSIIYLILSINEDLYAQKVWFFGKKSEINLVTRIIDRIEERATTLPLIPILTDEISLRPRFYNEKYDKKSPYVLDRSFIVRHIPSGMFNFYSPKEIFYPQSRISNITPELYQYLTTTSAIWPKTDSIYIDDTYVVIMTTKQGLSAIKQQLPK